MSTESFLAPHTGLWKNSCLEPLSATLGTVWGERNSSLRSPIPHRGRSTSAGPSLACRSSASSTSIPEPDLHEGTDLPGCGSTSQDLWSSKARRFRTFPQITITHLHTAQCSPSKTGLYSETDTRPSWCSHQTAARLAVLPLASCTGYSESALDPHKSDKRNDRLPTGKECRKQSQGHI